MIEANNPILSKMMDRLFVSMMDGPSMNCRPHASRQRIDLIQLEKLRDLSAGKILLSALGEGEAKLTAARHCQQGVKRRPRPRGVQPAGIWAQDWCLCLHPG